MRLHRVGQIGVFSRPRAFRFLVRVGAGRRCEVFFSAVGFLLNPSDRPSSWGMREVGLDAGYNYKNLAERGGFEPPLRVLAPKTV